MADTFTTVLNLTKPEVGASTDTWGTKLNADLDSLDSLFSAGSILKLVNGGTGAATAAAARTNLGLDTMATQSAGAVAITGGTINGVTAVNGTFGLAPTFVTSAGQVWAQATGFKFPDGTIQATSATVGGAPNWQTQTAGFSTLNGGAYYVTVNGVVVTLHSGAVNDTVRLVSGLASGSSFTVNPAVGQTIMGSSTLVVDKGFAALNLALIGTDWRIV